MDKQKLWSVLSLGLIVAFAGVVFIGNGKVGDLKITQTKNQAKIAELNSEIAELKEQLDYVPQEKLTEEEQEQVSSSAAELGNAVAGYQNAYAALSASGDREAFQANVDALDICFTDASKSARVPWYSGGRPGTWVFVTDGEFKGTNKEVLWLCQSPEDGALLAYATAVYDSTQNLFGEVDFQMSMLGNSTTEASGETPEGGIDPEQVGQITEQIQKVETPAERELTTEEIEQVKDAQQQLKELMTKQAEEAEGGEQDAD